jgi:hypothetical protein
MTIDKRTYILPETGGSTTNPTVVEGTTEVKGDTVVLISDMTVKELLEQILIELKIMNLRDEAVTGETVNYGDLSK